MFSAAIFFGEFAYADALTLSPQWRINVVALCSDSTPSSCTHWLQVTTDNLWGEPLAYRLGNTSTIDALRMTGMIGLDHHELPRKVDYLRIVEELSTNGCIGRLRSYASQQGSILQKLVDLVAKYPCGALVQGLFQEAHCIVLTGRMEYYCLCCRRMRCTLLRLIPKSVASTCFGVPAAKRSLNSLTCLVVSWLRVKRR